MERNYRAFALCALGLERVLGAELDRLGLSTSGRAPGRAYFEADAAGLFRANLCLRTAERVLIEAARFGAPDFDALFDQVRAAHWEEYCGKEDRLVIERVRVKDSVLSAQTSIQSVVHKAIYERLGAVYGLSRMPETGNGRSARVYLENDECVIGIDTSGEALHRRGYRKSTVEAPLKETVAAGCLLLAGWNRRIPLLDPFCGSGTILIEAALFGTDRAPGLGREFALEAMPLADPSAFGAEREAAKARIRTDVELCLRGRDQDPAALRAARENAERAGVGNLIVFEAGTAEEARPFADSGYLITNPPYGNRLGDESESEALYGRLGKLAPGFKGWGLGFVTNRIDFGEFFGRRAIAEHRVMNGSEEQWFHWYSPGWEDREPRPAASVPVGRRETTAPERGKDAAHGHEHRRETAPGHGAVERDGRDQRDRRDRMDWPERAGGGWRSDDRRKGFERKGGYQGAWPRPHGPDRGPRPEERGRGPSGPTSRDGRRPYADDNRRDRGPYGGHGGDQDRGHAPWRHDEGPRRGGGQEERRPWGPRDGRPGERPPWPQREPDRGSRAPRRDSYDRGPRPPSDRGPRPPSDRGPRPPNDRGPYRPRTRDERDDHKD